MFSRQSTAFRRRLWVLAACLAVSITPALPGWVEDYQAGVAALKQNDYDRAIAGLSLAAQEKPKEKASAIKSTGMFFDPYLPHYNLGLAYYGKKQYDKALAEFRLSAGQGVIAKYPDFNGRLESHLKLCEERLASGPSAPVPAPATENPEARALAAARQQSAEVSGAAGAFLQRSGPDLTPAERSSIEKLVAELNNAPDATAITRKAGELRGALDNTGRAVTSRQKAPIARQQPPALPVLKTSPPPEIKPTPAAPANPPPPQPTRPDTATLSALRRGAVSYFKGDDDAVVTTLSGVEDADAEFYLGSALYRKYLLGRQQDATLKDDAARHFKRVRTVSPGYRPNPRYFSPKVIDFFEQSAGRG